MNNKIYFVLNFIRLKIERRARVSRLYSIINKFLLVIESMVWNFRGYHVVEVLGDSHVKVFRRLNLVQYKERLKFRPCSVMGATLTGIENFESKTNARKKYEDLLLNLNSTNTSVAIMLGEVDLNFTIWFLAKKKDISIEAMLESVLQKYEQFILRCKESCENVIVFSPPLPTTDSNQDMDDYLSLRSEVRVPIKDRMDLSLAFCESLKKICNINGVNYIDLNPLSINKETGFLNAFLVNENSGDHHYNEIEFSNILTLALDKQSIFKYE